MAEPVRPGLELLSQPQSPLCIAQWQHHMRAADVMHPTYAVMAACMTCTAQVRAPVRRRGWNASDVITCDVGTLARWGRDAATREMLWEDSSGRRGWFRERGRAWMHEQRGCKVWVSGLVSRRPAAASWRGMHQLSQRRVRVPRGSMQEPRFEHNSLSETMLC